VLRKYMQSAGGKSSKTRGIRERPEGSFFDVVGIAASSGGIKAIAEVISGLPVGFPASVMVVQHLSPDFESRLAELLSKYTTLKVKEAEDGEKIARATVYIASPDKHMMVNSDGTISLTSLGKVHFTRPAADVLFVTMSISYKDRAIAVILTGAGEDGALGALAIKRAGGRTIVQEDPEAPSMPEAAIRIDDVDFIVPLAKIAPLLVNLVTKGKSE
jgi:two-component system chemotaxis response regulator CheB